MECAAFWKTLEGMGRGRREGCSWAVRERWGEEPTLSSDPGQPPALHYLIHCTIEDFLKNEMLILSKWEGGIYRLIYPFRHTTFESGVNVLLGVAFMMNS